MSQAIVIGAGPAGLMAAEQLATRGIEVTVCDAKPSVGRKFLMAGKSGLNLTKDEPFDVSIAQYREAQSPLRPMLEAFDGQAVQRWSEGLGQEVFTGSTGRVFPRAMKASPLLRAWLVRLGELGVVMRTNLRWQGWDGDAVIFDGPNGRENLTAPVVVLALGGASWARLGSDGAWTSILTGAGVPLSPFAPANVGIRVNWSEHMAPHFGTALKGIALRAGDFTSRGEAVIGRQGLEGGGLYEVSRGIREGHPLVLDLVPGLGLVDTMARLDRPSGKASLSNHLRKMLRLDAAKIALAQEFARPLPKAPKELATLLKSLTVPNDGLRDIDQAISVAGGVPFAALDDRLMLTARPGVFCAGEMLDWEAPTGGYLITGCLATGRWAGLGAADYLAEAV